MVQYIISLFIGIVIGSGTTYVVMDNNAKGIPAQRCSQGLDNQIQEINRIHIGSTRQELSSMFVQLGGFVSPHKSRYYYRKNNHIQIDVEFECQTDERGRTVANPQDRVTKLSSPFLSPTCILD